MNTDYLQIGLKRKGNDRMSDVDSLRPIAQNYLNLHKGLAG